MKTNLSLVGEDKWGNSISRRLFRDENGTLSVAVRRNSSIRRVFVPYKAFMASSMSFGYIWEG